MLDLGGIPEQVIRTDRFYALDAGPESGMFDLHDWAALLDLLHGLRSAPAPSRLAYLGRTYEGVERVADVPMPPVILCEGIRLLRPETELWETKWIPEAQLYAASIKPEELAHVIIPAPGQE